jgi:hypothetical protein
MAPSGWKGDRLPLAQHSLKRTLRAKVLGTFAPDGQGGRGSLPLVPMGRRDGREMGGGSRQVIVIGNVASPRLSLRPAVTPAGHAHRQLICTQMAITALDRRYGSGGIRIALAEARRKSRHASCGTKVERRRMTSRHEESLIGHLFEWPVVRTSKSYRVVVIEPPAPDPATHADIFFAAITSLFSPIETAYSDLRANSIQIDPFDLATFPEAFLPAQNLIEAIKHLVNFGNFGCVHVGLRPDTGHNHLFAPDALVSLVESLKAIPEVHQGDLEGFNRWLMEQSNDHRFNIACLFTTDDGGKIRICLHPKMVRSRYEVAVLPENDMTAANVVTLITLRPTDPQMMSITIQPLICSDALQLDPDLPGHLPLSAINERGGCFRTPIPDYVDIVSVATCTPQLETPEPHIPKSRRWHKQFRTSFIRSAEDPDRQRHAHSLFVLSNFWSVDVGTVPTPGGLSGVFLPVPPVLTEFPDYVEVSTYGLADGGVENDWSAPASRIQKGAHRGYIAQLTPYGADLPVSRMMSMVVNRLPRHVAPWASRNGLRKMRLETAKAPEAGYLYSFSEKQHA